LQHFWITTWDTCSRDINWSEQPRVTASVYAQSDCIAEHTFSFQTQMTVPNLMILFTGSNKISQNVSFINQGLITENEDPIEVLNSAWWIEIFVSIAFFLENISNFSNFKEDFLKMNIANGYKLFETILLTIVVGI